MNVLFSVRTLIAVGSVVLALIAAYLVFLIAPHLEPVWNFFKTVVTPFILALIMVYLLNPVVHFLMKFNLKRKYAILLLFLLIVVLLVGLGRLGVPLFVSQVKELLEELPEIEQQMGGWLEMLNGQIEQLPYGVHMALDNVNYNLEQSIRQEIEEIVLAVADWLGSFFVLLVVPFLTFYLLRDVAGLQKAFYFLIPRKKRKTASNLWKHIDHSLGEYIRGQITVSLVVGVLAGIGYTLIGLPYPLFLAFIVAVTNVIPYFGPFIGAAPALLVALITEPSLILWVILVNTIIQLLEGNFLGPYIVGKRLRIHPVFIIFALLVGAELGGVLGLLVAVPVFVTIKVIVVNIVLYFRRYKTERRSPLSGDNP